MRPAHNEVTNYYGSTTSTTTTTTAADEDSATPRQTFSIAEPTYNETNGNGIRSRQQGVKGSSSLNCCRSSGDPTDGLRIIIISMFVFSVGVTVALIIQIASESSGEIHDTDTVVSGNEACSGIGQNILASGGNAVDAAVASTFCMAMVEPHITGFGGGGLMLIHMHRSNKTVVLDFRETAPAGAKIDRYIQNPLAATIGRLSVGVPGFVAGLEYAHKKYGSGHVGPNCCQWSDLLWNTVGFVLRGVHVSQHFINATQTKMDADALTSQEASRLRDFIHPKGTDLTFQSLYGDIPMYNSLIQTLKEIAVNGSEPFYKGQIGRNIVETLGGSITMEDLASYSIIEREPVITTIGDYEVMVTPSPSGGPELLAFLNTMEAFNKTHGLKGMDIDYLETVSKVLRRLNKLQLGLGDPENDTLIADRIEWLLNKENIGRLVSEKGQSANFETSSYSLPESVSSTVSVMDRKDNYVAVVTSLNTWFGSKVMTEDGILLNNAMANFNIPSDSSPDQLSSSTANQLSRGKRPLTNCLAALALDTKNICGRRILTGGASPGSVGQVLYDPLLLAGDLSTSTSNARIIVRNDTIYLEDALKGFNPQLLANFRENFEYLKLPYSSVHSLEKSVDAVMKIQDIRSRGDDDSSEQEENESKLN